MRQISVITVVRLWLNYGNFCKKLKNCPILHGFVFALHNDTDIVEYDGEEQLELWGDTIVVCTCVQASELEELMKCQWLCSDGAEECDISDLDALFSCRPPVPEGFQCFEIVWD